MGQVVHLASIKNDRRAEAETERRARILAERLEDQRHGIAQMLGGDFPAQVLADIVVDVLEERRQAERPHFTPAYCNPSNEVRGAKYEATSKLDVTEIAARIRKDIADAKRRREIDPKVTVSVRSDRYAGGCSIDVRVTALPAGFKVLSPRALDAALRGEEFIGHWEDRLSDELKALKGALTAIHSAYNRDNSDSSVDYFDTRFHGSVEIDWKLRDEMEKVQVAAARPYFQPELL